MNKMPPPSPQSESAKPPTISQKIRRGIGRLFKGIFLFVVLYLLIVALGLIPVNNDFEPTPDGVEIFLTSTAVHADVVVPITNDIVNWRDHLKKTDFRSDTTKVTHAAFGWGDKGFYIGTPTWGELKASTVAWALLWPTDACMHVGMWNRADIPADARKVVISRHQYKKLVNHIKASFKADQKEQFVFIKDAAYGNYDAFYEAHGTYHGLNTCNCWAGRTIRAGGIRVGWLTPLPKSMFLYLPEQE